MDIKDYLNSARRQQAESKDQLAVSKGMEEVSAIQKLYADFQRGIRDYTMAQFLAPALVYLLDAMNDLELLLKDCPDPDNTDTNREKRKLRARMLSELYQKYHQ